MKYIVPFSAIFFSGMVSANRMSPGDSYYEQIEAMFNAGAEPQGETLVDHVWSGRCYTRQAPFTPSNAGYIFRLKSESTGEDKISPPRFEAASYWREQSAADIYDDLTLSDVIEESGKSLPFYPVRFLEKSVVLHLPSGATSRLRTSGKFLVEELTNRHHSHSHLVCYYFQSAKKR